MRCTDGETVEDEASKLVSLPIPPDEFANVFARGSVPLSGDLRFNERLEVVGNGDEAPRWVPKRASASGGRPPPPIKHGSGDDGNRTHYLFDANEALCQMSYIPENRRDSSARRAKDSAGCGTAEGAPGPYSPEARP